MIYFIQSGKDGPIKIGHADNVKKRLQSLQIGSPAKLRILRVFNSPNKKEAEIHKALSKYRIRGEWYEPSKDVLMYARRSDLTDRPKNEYNILKEKLVESIVNTKYPPLLESVNLLLTIHNTSILKIAKQAGISRTAAYNEIKGIKKCPRFRKQVQKSLGFIPWDSQ